MKVHVATESKHSVAHGGKAQKAPSKEGRNVKIVEAGFCLPARTNRNNGRICKTNTTSESTSHSIGTNTAAGLLVQDLFTPPTPLQLEPLLLALLLGLLGLEVLVGEVGGGTTDEDDSVDTDTEAGGIARRRRRDRTGLGGLRGWVAGLQDNNYSSADDQT